MSLSRRSLNAIEGSGDETAIGATLVAHSRPPHAREQKNAAATAQVS